MKSLLSFAFIFTCIGINAQNNLVVFSENGEKFFLIINGVKQNIEVETNVKVTDLIQPQYKAKIVFEDKVKGVVDQNIYFMQGGEPVKNHEFVYSVGMKKKGMYKARPVSAVAIGETKTDASQTIVHYATSEPTPAHNNVISDGSSTNNVNVADDGTIMNSNSNANTSSQVDQTVTHTQTNTNNTNVGVNMDGMGVSINVNDNVGMGNGSTTTTSQTVTTTSKSSSGTPVNKTSTMNSSTSTSGTTKNSTTTTSTKSKVTDGYETGTTVSTACAAMSTNDFNSAKESINSKSFDDSKLKIAKQILDNNCMSSGQVKEVMGLLTFEQAKLDLAKYAYGRTTDKNNYYKLNDAFTFESSITELDNHIKKSNK